MDAAPRPPPLAGARGFVTLAHVVEATAHRVQSQFSDLLSHAHALPPESRAHNLLLFLHGARQQLLRCAALLHDPRKLAAAERAADAGGALDAAGNHARALQSTADELWRAEAETRAGRVAAGEASTALDVLAPGAAGGLASRLLPARCADLAGGEPLRPASRRRALVAAMDHLLRARLAGAAMAAQERLEENQEEAKKEQAAEGGGAAAAVAPPTPAAAVVGALPPGLELVGVSGGTAVLRCEGLYEARVALAQRPYPPQAQPTDSDLGEQEGSEDGEGEGEGEGDAQKPATTAKTTNDWRWAWIPIGVEMFPNAARIAPLRPVQRDQLLAALAQKMGESADLAAVAALAARRQRRREAEEKNKASKAVKAEGEVDAEMADGEAPAAKAKAQPKALASRIPVTTTPTTAAEAAREAGNDHALALAAAGADEAAAPLRVMHGVLRDVAAGLLLDAVVDAANALAASGGAGAGGAEASSAAAADDAGAPGATALERPVVLVPGVRLRYWSHAPPPLLDDDALEAAVRAGAAGGLAGAAGGAGGAGGGAGGGTGAATAASASYAASLPAVEVGVAPDGTVRALHFPPLDPVPVASLPPLSSSSSAAAAAALLLPALPACRPRLDSRTVDLAPLLLRAAAATAARQLRYLAEAVATRLRSNPALAAPAAGCSVELRGVGGAAATTTSAAAASGLGGGELVVRVDGEDAFRARFDLWTGRLLLRAPERAAAAADAEQHEQQPPPLLLPLPLSPAALSAQEERLAAAAQAVASAAFAAAAAAAADADAASAPALPSLPSPQQQPPSAAAAAAGALAAAAAATPPPPDAPPPSAAASTTPTDPAAPQLAAARRRQAAARAALQRRADGLVSLARDALAARRAARLESDARLLAGGLAAVPSYRWLGRPPGVSASSSPATACSFFALPGTAVAARGGAGGGGVGDEEEEDAAALADGSGPFVGGCLAFLCVQAAPPPSSSSAAAPPPPAPRMWLATAACDARGLTLPSAGEGRPAARYVPVPLAAAMAALAASGGRSGGKAADDDSNNNNRGLSGLARELRAAAAWCCARAPHERLLHELDALGADYEELLLPPSSATAAADSPTTPPAAARAAAAAAGGAAVIRLLRLPSSSSSSSSSRKGAPPPTVLPRAARRREGLPGPASVGVGQVLLTADGAEASSAPAAAAAPRSLCCGQRWSLWTQGAFYAGTVPGQDAGGGWLRLRCSFGRTAAGGGGSGGSGSAVGGAAAVLLGVAAASARVQRALAALEGLTRGKQSLAVLSFGGGLAPEAAGPAGALADGRGRGQGGRGGGAAAAAADGGAGAGGRRGRKRAGGGGGDDDEDAEEDEGARRGAKRPRSGTPPPDSAPALLLWHWPGTALVRLVAVLPSSFTLEAGPPPLPPPDAAPPAPPDSTAIALPGPSALRLNFSWGHAPLQAPEDAAAATPRLWLRAASAARVDASPALPSAALAALAAAAAAGDWSFVLDASALCGWPLVALRRGALAGRCLDAPGAILEGSGEEEEAPLGARVMVVGRGAGAADAAASCPSPAAAVAIEARFFSHGRVLLALRPVAGASSSQQLLPPASAMAAAFLCRLERERAGNGGGGNGPCPAAWPAASPLGGVGVGVGAGAFWVHASQLDGAVARLADMLRREVLAGF